MCNLNNSMYKPTQIIKSLSLKYKYDLFLIQIYIYVKNSS